MYCSVIGRKRGVRSRPVAFVRTIEKIHTPVSVFFAVVPLFECARSFRSAHGLFEYFARRLRAIAIPHGLLRVRTVFSSTSHADCERFRTVFSSAHVFPSASHTNCERFRALLRPRRLRVSTTACAFSTGSNGVNSSEWCLKPVSIHSSIIA